MMVSIEQSAVWFLYRDGQQQRYQQRWCGDDEEAGAPAVLINHPGAQAEPDYRRKGGCRGEAADRQRAVARGI
ncbi:hypothetical protein D3C80_2115280 [compost metagenome]